MVVLWACGSLGTAADSSSVPEYKDQPVQGTVQGESFSIASARSRKVSVEGQDEQVMQLYGQEHGDLCSGLSVGDPPVSDGERYLRIDEIPPETGRYEVGGQVELSFYTPSGGVPAIGWIEIEEVTETTIRGRLAAVEKNNENHTVTGNFEADRCGCVNC
jgi:hypothetical protein